MKRNSLCNNEQKRNAAVFSLGTSALCGPKKKKKKKTQEKEKETSRSGEYEFSRRKIVPCRSPRNEYLG